MTNYHGRDGTSHPRIYRMGVELEGQFRMERYNAYVNGPLYYNRKYLDELANYNYEGYVKQSDLLHELERRRSKSAGTSHPYIWSEDGSVSIHSTRPNGLEARALIHLRYYGPALPHQHEIIQMYSSENGELKSIPLTPRQLQNFVRYNHPDKQNESCGTHVHLSTNDKYDYERLATPAFYYWFMGQAAHWAASNLEPGSDAEYEFWQRYNGENKYCCRNYVACSEHTGECQHNCDDDCRELECRHDCESRTQMSRARQGDWSCLEHNCSHECDEYCCANDHDHNAEDELCNQGACAHTCNDMDCFDMDECQHDHTGDCYGECQHNCDDSDNECFGIPKGVGIHIPSEQRTDNNHDSRYGHLNFCEAKHNTLEVRLGPAFYDAELCVSWVTFIADAVQCYLDMEGEAKVERPMPEAKQLGLYEPYMAHLEIVSVAA
jgi:hypothetical protein